MSDLRACPFCGGTDIIIDLDHAWCEECLSDGPARNGRDAIAAAWNKRTPDYERKWAELVKTISTRTDQRKVTP